MIYVGCLVNDKDQIKVSDHLQKKKKCRIFGSISDQLHQSLHFNEIPEGSASPLMFEKHRILVNSSAKKRV